MQSRMDKYENNSQAARSRTQKNQQLYEDLRNSVLADFNVNSNVSVIDEQADVIDVERIKQILDKKYKDDAPKRRSIEIPDYPEPVIEDTLVDTKEYDINAILEKAKKGKNVDYNKERLKKIREAQYEILNNLDLELRKVEEGRKSVAIRESEEKDIVNLMNTITQLELKNKEEKNTPETDDLFDSLLKTQAIDPVKEPINYAMPDDEEDTAASSNEKIEYTLPDIPEIKLPEKEIKSDETSVEEAESEEETDDDDDDDETEDEKTTELIEQIEEVEEKQESHLEETLTKLNIDTTKYEGFEDVSKSDGLSIALRILAFIIVIGLVFGAVYIINNVLELGLF